MDQIDYLIELLFDASARIDERDDAAMDLGDFDDDRALNALIAYATNENNEDFMMEACGESIARVLVHRDQFDINILNKLHPQAYHEAKSYIKGHKPQWLKDS